MMSYLSLPDLHYLVALLSVCMSAVLLFCRFLIYINPLFVCPERISLKISTKELIITKSNAEE